MLVGAVERRLRELILEKAAANGWVVRSLEIMPDHVHVFLSAAPSDSVALILSVLKGGTSKVLRTEFPLLRKVLPTLWTRSYYVESVGHVSEKAIMRYIEDQKLRPKGERHSSHD